MELLENNNNTSKMVDTQHFCLRWNNYQSSITSAFENLRDDEDFVDVTLACDGRSLKAHRVVLSACSPYFRELLKSTPCKHPVIVLQDVAFTDLHALVEFIYHGEVNVHQRSLSSFLKTAEVLRVSGLTQQQAEETHNLAQVQSLAQPGGRTPLNHHQSFTDKLVEEALQFPHGASPPPHLNNMHNPSAHSGATVNQLLRRAAAAAAMRRERNSSCHSDDLQLKRHRPDSGLMGPNINNNNNNLDIINHMPQITATDFSTNIKHMNNISPHIKDTDRLDVKTPNVSLILGNNNNTLSTNNNNPNSNNNNLKETINLTTNGNGGGSLGSTTDKESLTPSPSARSTDDVKTEPMELVSNSISHDDEHSNDSVVDADRHSSNGNESKGPLRLKYFSGSHEDDMETGSIHNHTAPPFLMSPSDKLFPPPGSFNFSMAALTDPNALANFNSMQNAAAELAGSPQASGGISTTPGGTLTEDFRCDPCNKNLSSLTRLKRHIQNVHMRPTKEPVCNICKRVYSSLNSLRNHKSIYHRNMKQPKVETKDDGNSTGSIRAPNYPFFPINPRTA
ncbi:broad-complex core protein isoforms 1/2/3/4/5 isoform X12 [Chironomus tepperi]|uniref:broad-complex core protein isoforms 1/2/3/4/5 isoform X12 n=1 Tax=Chironomus tepperi TaxID=113505 RepID=UPI00391EF762